MFMIQSGENRWAHDDRWQIVATDVDWIKHEGTDRIDHNVIIHA